MASRLLPILSLAFLSLFLGCEDRTTLDEFNTRVVTLPDGYKIRAEIMVRPEDVMRGMMFRDSLPPDRGMLFLHGEPGNYPYWMYQVEIPLDIIWMDLTGRIVEMSPNTPPCGAEKASECPNYGGTKVSSIVLEVAAGTIERHNLRVGQRIRQ
jgi:uncharacterized membrane protein (UPF0127 family)